MADDDRVRPWHWPGGWLRGTVLIPTLALIVLLIESRFATGERRIAKRLVRRSNDLRTNLHAIRKELDEMQATSSQDP
jgi:hypothetical protein